MILLTKDNSILKRWKAKWTRLFVNSKQSLERISGLTREEAKTIIIERVENELNT